eukprot:2204093-Pyramimonas_sp.AAC.1
MSRMGPVESTANAAVFEGLRGGHKLLLNRHLPQIVQWCARLLGCTGAVHPGRWVRDCGRAHEAGVWARWCTILR